MPSILRKHSRHSLSAGRCAGWLLSAVLFGSISVWGAGYQLYTEGSAEALAQAAAISGRTNLISLAWYNPAALAGSDQPAILLGSVFVLINTDFNSDLDAANDRSMVRQWRTIPHFYYVHPVSEAWTAVVAVNAPYGLITEWPNGWIGENVAIDSELSTLYTTPSVAYRINQQWAVSAGVNMVAAKAELTAWRGAFGERKISGDDLGYGYTASAHWKGSDDWAVGLRYQSQVKLTIEGDARFEANPLAPGETEFDGAADVTLPASVNFGLANYSVDNLRVGLDFTWTEWSAYDALVYEFEADYPAVLDNPEDVPKRWHNVWSVRVGGEYSLTDSCVVRAGYVWDESPVNDDTRAPELPGSDRQMMTAGAGWKRESWGVDLAYAYLWAKTSRTGSEVVNANPPATLGTAGTYDADTHIVALSVHYHF